MTRGALSLVFGDEQGAGASPQPLRACSACAGDYEDPDRTAWFAESEEGEPPSAEWARTSVQEGTQEKAGNEAGDDGATNEDMNAEDEDDDEFPAKET